MSEKHYLQLQLCDVSLLLWDRMSSITYVHCIVLCKQENMISKYHFKTMHSARKISSYIEVGLKMEGYLY